MRRSKRPVLNKEIRSKLSLPKRASLSKEFKQAIAELPDKDKNKFLYRLLAQRPDLVEQLTFEILENGATTIERREDLETEIREITAVSVSEYQSPGYLLLILRFLSGAINRHLKTTKDKYGEIQLNFLMLNTTLAPLEHQLQAARPQKAKTLNQYVIKRAMKLLKLLAKQHPDLHFDFKEDMQALGQTIGNVESMSLVAKQHGLDINCLLEGEVPDPG